MTADLDPLAAERVFFAALVAAAARRPSANSPSPRYRAPRNGTGSFHAIATTNDDDGSSADGPFVG